MVALKSGGTDIAPEQPPRSTSSAMPWAWTSPAATCKARPKKKKRPPLGSRQKLRSQGAPIGLITPAGSGGRIQPLAVSTG